jgi:hypothetical protein
MNLRNEYWRLYSTALNIRHAILINTSLNFPPGIFLYGGYERAESVMKIMHGALNIIEDIISRLDS